MATVATSITRVRRLVKDTGSDIFTDARLLRLYNLARRRFFRETRLRVRGAVLPNPSVIFYGIAHRWESGEVSSLSFWEPFFQDSVNYYSCTQPWEVQTSLATESYDAEGGYCITSPQEVINVEQTNPVPHVLPEEFHELLYMAWEDKQVYVKNKEWLMDYDDNWKNRQSDEVLFASLDLWPGEKKFFPFPCPTSESTEISRDGALGAGFLSYVESGDPDDLDWDAGSVGAVYDITKINAEDEGTGVVLEIATSSDGFTVFFVCVPADVATTDTDILPRPFRKYVEFLCAALALESDTDLKDSQKAQLLRVRYVAGVGLTKMMKKWLKSDRVFRLRAVGEDHPHGIGRRRPRLPAHYPRVW